jgi:tetratricopeptide (TPR) repeat protein/TolB-like protein
MNKKKKDFFQELRDRNVWREVKAYLLSGAAGIPFLIALHQFDSNIIDVESVRIICIIYFTLFPSVFLFAYHHGESREKPWSKAEKIGIPTNIIITLLLVFFFYNNEVEATEFEKVLIQNPLTQIMEEREVLKPEYRKRLKICYFENQSGDTTLNWMQQGIMEACNIDLDQESYITNNPFWWYRFQEKYKYGENIRFTSYLKAAKSSNTQYILNGTFTQEKETYSISCNLVDVKTARSISKKTFKGDNFFSLIDSISHHTKITLLSNYDIEKTIDLPISSQLTNSLPAYKYYTLASEAWYKDDAQTTNELHLYQKAIELDPRFAQAYMACIWEYNSQNKLDSINLCWNKVMDNLENYPEKERYAIRYDYLQHSKKYEQAFELLQSWVAFYPEEIDPYSYLAWYYKEKEMYQEAINKYKKCISIDSLNDSYYRSIAWIYEHELKDYQEAIRWKKKYANITGNKYAAYRSIASYYDGIREIDSVKYYYNKALLIEPTKLSVNRALARIDMFDITDYNIKKKRWLELMLYAKDQYDTLSILKNIRSALKLHGQYKKAEMLGDSINDLQKGKDWLGDNKEIKKVQKLTDGSLDLLAIGRHKEVIDIVERVTNFYDSITPPYSNKEKLLKEHSEVTKAVAKMYYIDILNAFCYDENTKEEHLYILDNYLIRLEHEKEEQEKHRTMGFQTEDKQIDDLKARIFALKKNYTKAIQLLEKHRDKSSSDFELIQLARYYQELEKYKKAEEIFNLIINKPNVGSYNRAITNYYAALLYHKSGKQEKAQENLKFSLETWKYADADYIFSNMAKTTAQEWNIEILN